jgi:trigger factor
VRVLIGKKATYPVPGFAAQIIGMNADETRAFDIALPKKAKDIADELRGRTIHFEVKCADVMKRDLPQLDDDFAQSVGEYTNLADLRTKLREQLEIEAERTSKNEYTSKIFDKLINTGIVKVSYPPVIVDQQIDDMIEDFERQLKRQGMNLDDYLNLNNLTRDDLRAEFRDSADQQVRRGLILGEVCEQEHLTVSDEEIEDEIQTQLLSFGVQAALARQLYSAPDVRRSLANHRLTDKGLERLMQIARGEAPPIDVEAPSGDKSASATKKKRASTAKPKKPRVKKAEPATK